MFGTTNKLSKTINTQASSDEIMQANNNTKGSFEMLPDIKNMKSHTEQRSPMAILDNQFSNDKP